MLCAAGCELERLAILGRKKEFVALIHLRMRLVTNWVCKQTSYLMKKAMLLSGAFAVVCLTLISCGGTPETTTTTTRQTTVTAAPPPPTQTTTTTHMSGGY